MNRKVLLLIVLIVFIVVVIAAGRFFIINFSGALPLLSQPSFDISDTSFDIPLSIPADFTLSIYAKDLGKARDMIRGPAGNLLVSIVDEGKVVALIDDDNDGTVERIVIVASGLNKPHGLATRCFPVAEAMLEFDCNLYIAETDQVAMYDFDREHLKATNKRTIIDLPGGGNHFTRSITFGTGDNADTLFTSVGSTCNVCNEKNSRRASILSSDPFGGGLEVFASGLRNSVFMAVHPETEELWATEMGRDLLGDDLPPDEINIVRRGGNYGWPTCYGKNIHDTNFDKNVYVRAPCTEPFEISSYIDIPAHSSPLGLAFVPKEGWPADFQNNLFVAYHGSWNRSEPTGYRIVRYKLDKEGVYRGEEDFITGWFTSEGEVIGRPVDILIETGGIMYISDDRAGVVYRIVYQPE